MRHRSKEVYNNTSSLGAKTEPTVLCTWKSWRGREEKEVCKDDRNKREFTIAATSSYKCYSHVRCHVITKLQTHCQIKSNQIYLYSTFHTASVNSMCLKTSKKKKKSSPCSTEYRVDWPEFTYAAYSTRTIVAAKEGEMRQRETEVANVGERRRKSTSERFESQGQEVWSMHDYRVNFLPLICFPGVLGVTPVWPFTPLSQSFNFKHFPGMQTGLICLQWLFFMVKFKTVHNAHRSM